MFDFYFQYSQLNACIESDIIRRVGELEFTGKKKRLLPPFRRKHVVLHHLNPSRLRLLQFEYNSAIVDISVVDLQLGTHEEDEPPAGDPSPRPARFEA